jgi:hypothetical protein
MSRTLRATAWLLLLLVAAFAAGKPSTTGGIVEPGAPAEDRAQIYADLIKWATDHGAVINFELREVAPGNWASFATRNLEVDICHPFMC